MSVRVFDCPSCGAQVKFESSIAVSSVCAFCRSIVVLRGSNVETLGIVAELPPDLTPLQPGTRGSWQGKGFEIIGRLRVAWEDGSWNEWCAEFGDHRQGWIAEAQGLYMVSFAQRVSDLPTEPRSLHAGASLKLDGREWSVVDVKDVRCVSGEGQLPFEFPPEWQRTSVDLTSTDGAFASLEEDEDGVTFYSGHYARFTDLQFDNLRPVPGWSAEVEAVRHQTATLNCLSCGAAVSIRAAGLTMAAVCGSCGSIVDTSNPHLQLIQEADERTRKLRPLLPIGQRGRLLGTEYEVIGVAFRKDTYSTWHEYLLFNPWYGFDWLVTFRGHWSFVRRVPELPDFSGSTAYYERRPYELFAAEEATVTGVLGEFYWKVRRGEMAATLDWIHPPYILSKEVYAGLNEFTWSHGQYIEPALVAEAFGVKDLPEPTGVYLNQPNRATDHWHEIRTWALVFFAAYVFIQILFASRIVDTPVYQGEFVFHRADPTKVSTSPHFELKGGTQPVWVEAVAQIKNSWIGVDVDLVNARTNETRTAPISIEYYDGYEGGEYWSEGSETDTASFTAVPPGEYFLNIDAEADASASYIPYRITVRRGGVFWSNFWTGLVLLLSYPAWAWYRSYSFERSRWAESDYSPYASNDDDDE